MGLSVQRSNGYAMLMSPNKGKTAVHGCHCQGDMNVRMHKVMAMGNGVDMCASVLILVVFQLFLGCPSYSSHTVRRYYVFCSQAHRGALFTTESRRTPLSIHNWL